MCPLLQARREASRPKGFTAWLMIGISGRSAWGPRTRITRHERDGGPYITVILTSLVIDVMTHVSLLAVYLLTIMPTD